MPRRIALGLLVLIVLLGVGLRSYHLTARSLWFDEAFSWRLSQFPIPELLDRDAQDVHPPLYYILLKVWTTVFGASLLALRSFSVFLAALTIAFCYLFVSYAFSSRRLGLLAALLIAIAGFQIQFSWEARMYTLGTALALLSMWALLHALRQTTSRVWWWIAYGTITAAFLYTHYYAVFSVAAQVLFLVGYMIGATRGRIGELLQWRLSWHVLLSWVVTAILFLPWLPIFFRQTKQVQASFWILPLDRWSLPDTFYRMFLPTVGYLDHSGWRLAVYLLPIFAMGMLWIALLLRTHYAKDTQRHALWLVVLSGLLPFVLSTLFSLLNSQSVYQDRFFVFAHLFVLIAVAYALDSIRWRVPRIAFVAAGAVVLLYADVTYWQALNILAKPGAHAAAQAVFAQRTTNEPVVVSSPFAFFAIDHYATEEFKLPGVVKLFSESGQVVHFAGGPILAPHDIVNTLQISVTKSPTVWVVDTTGFGGQPLQLGKEWQATHSERFREIYDYQGEIIVTHYERLQ